MTINEIRPFIPTHDFKTAQTFYKALGFNMDYVTDEMSLFRSGTCHFFLYQAAENKPLCQSMLQLIVDDVQEVFNRVTKLEGDEVRFEPIQVERWGKVFYLWGPSGEQWHVTELN